MTRPGAAAQWAAAKSAHEARRATLGGGRATTRCSDIRAGEKVRPSRRLLRGERDVVVGGRAAIIASQQTGPSGGPFLVSGAAGVASMNSRLLLSQPIIGARAPEGGGGEKTQRSSECSVAGAANLFCYFLHVSPSRPSAANDDDDNNNSESNEEGCDPEGCGQI